MNTVLVPAFSSTCPRATVVGFVVPRTVTVRVNFWPLSRMTDWLASVESDRLTETTELGMPFELPATIVLVVTGRPRFTRLLIGLPVFTEVVPITTGPDAVRVTSFRSLEIDADTTERPTESV